jgi:hypothetical protein
MGWIVKERGFDFWQGEMIFLFSTNCLGKQGSIVG